MEFLSPVTTEMASEMVSEMVSEVTMEMTSGMTTEMTSQMAAVSPSNVTVVSVFKAFLLGITAALVILGNSMCLIVLIHTRDGVSPVTRLFLISLTISDLLVGLLVCIPIVGSTALQRWPYGDAYCTLVATCHVFYFNAGLSVLAINVERYIAVIWPLTYTTVVTMRRAIAVEAFFVALLLTWTALYVFPPHRASFYYNNFSQCYIDAQVGSDYIGHVGMSLFIAAPIFITVILHVRLFFLASKHAARVANITVGDIEPSRGDSGVTDSHGSSADQRALANPRRGPARRHAARKSPEARAARTFFIMAMVLTVSWAPYYTTITWENLRTDKIPEGVAFASQLLLLLNSFWNVIIYYTRNGPFRKTANRLFGCCFRGREQQLIA